MTKGVTTEAKGVQMVGPGVAETILPDTLAVSELMTSHRRINTARYSSRVWAYDMAEVFLSIPGDCEVSISLVTRTMMEAKVCLFPRPSESKPPTLQERFCVHRAALKALSSSVPQ